MGETIKIKKNKEGVEIEIADKRYERFIDKEYLVNINHMIDSLIKEFEYSNFEWNIKADEFEIEIIAIPKEKKKT